MSANVRLDIRPTERELRWFAHIDRHGPQSSEYLYELTRDTHRCKDTALRRLQALREAECLRRPPQQNQIAKADFNPNVYDLTSKGFDHLNHVQALERHTRPTGHWWHSFLTSSVTSGFSIEAARRGCRYIPAHKLLNRSGATLAVPFGKRILIPDQFFAIDYGGSFRSFVLEVDRGTEPYRSAKARKSLKSMLELYDQVWANDAARSHYGLRSPLLILLVFASPHRRAKCMDLLHQVAPRLAPFALFQVVPNGFPRFETMQVVFSGNWQRVLNDPLAVF